MSVHENSARRFSCRKTAPRTPVLQSLSAAAVKKRECAALVRTAYKKNAAPFDAAFLTISNSRDLLGFVLFRRPGFVFFERQLPVVVLVMGLEEGVRTIGSAFGERARLEFLERDGAVTVGIQFLECFFRTPFWFVGLRCRFFVRGNCESGA
jgi:hypothetical protein